MLFLDPVSLLAKHADSFPLNLPESAGELEANIFHLCFFSPDLTWADFFSTGMLDLSPRDGPLCTGKDTLRDGLSVQRRSYKVPANHTP